MKINTSLLGSFLCLLCISFTQAQSVSDLCSSKLTDSGVNYFSHPRDCDKFVQCHVDARGRLVGEIQQCAFSTYWSTKYVTCLPVDQVRCDNDICLNKPNGYIRAGEGNCRGFWECQNDKSQPKCCPVGQRFDGMLGCVEAETDEQECKDMCFNEVKEVNDTMLCEKRPVAEDKTMYEIQLPVFGWIKRPCSPGTVFNQDMCECVHVKEYAKAQCKPEIHLPFTANHSDMSGNGFYIGNYGVIVKDGVAQFNGRDSRLTIPRLNNIEHLNTLVIDIVYRSNHSLLQERQALVSNSDCNTLPSIFITEDKQFITFGTDTTNKFMVSTYVPQPNETVKRIRYKLVGEVLTGKVNGQSSSEKAEGFIRNIQCNLSVGHSANMASFLGQIDELTIYLCDPEGNDSKPVPN